MKSSESMVLEEGGDSKDIQIISTIPILCQDPSPDAECCLELEASVTSGSQRCPDGSDLGRVEVGEGGCKPKICREDFNRSVAIPVRVRDDNIVNGNDEVTVHFKVSDDSGLWDHVKIPGQKVGGANQGLPHLMALPVCSRKFLFLPFSTNRKDFVSLCEDVIRVLYGSPRRRKKSLVI